MLYPLYNNNKNVKSNISHHYAVIGWYIIFLFIIPSFIKNTYSFDNLKYYLPMVDLIANSFSASGGPDSLFKNLYSLSPYNLISFLSTNFINLVALLGVSWNGISHAFRHKSLWTGVTVTMFMYIITYLIPTQMIPYVVDKVQSAIHENKNIELDFTILGKRIHMEDYIVSLLVIFALVMIEYISIQVYINFIRNI